MLIFDIETGGLPEDQLRELYVEPTYDEFAASCDQRWKDETKREKFEKAKADGWQQFVERAALSPITGQVLAVGYRAGAGTDGKSAIVSGEEADILAAFWKKYAECRSKQRKLAGWNIFGFDLPFLIRRSWKLEVDIPATVRDPNDRYWDSVFVDLMARFSVGEWKSNTKLDVAARFLGAGKKTDGVGGGDFARLWRGTEEERQQAVAYLMNDLEITAGVGRRMGLA